MLREHLLTNASMLVHAAGSPGEAERLRRQLALLKTQMVSAAASQEAEAERVEQVGTPNQAPNKPQSPSHIIPATEAFLAP